MPFEVLSMMYSHPLTDQGIDIFLKDAAKIPAMSVAAQPEPAKAEAPLEPTQAPVPPAPEPAKTPAAASAATPAKPGSVPQAKTPPAVFLRRSSGTGSG